MQIIAAKYLFLETVLMVTNDIGFSFIAVSLAKDIKNELKLINDRAQMKTTQILAVKQLSEWIEFHSTAKKLSNFVVAFVIC